MDDDGTARMTVGGPATGPPGAVGERERRGPAPAHQERFGWVVAAPGVRTGS
ncbi:MULTISPECIES: hypothetical protein [Streptomyces]|uniref:Uncharacterized protein n=1 Tax=Streptomyces plicatus TaxID=1922 RepID=A0ABW1Y201_STRPL|nr:MULTISPECIES: hypothetical protein [Streptomyces]MBU8552037.1 hypothetical protein [Streptomyces sp. Osf17]MBU8558819.1 hypothetical protein [Streptomyces sp. Babs14]